MSETATLGAAAAPRRAGAAWDTIVVAEGHPVSLWPLRAARPGNRHEPGQLEAAARSSPVSTALWPGSRLGLVLL